MPYKSEKQRRYMHAKHPEIARRWDKEYGGQIEKGLKDALKNAAEQALRAKKKAGEAVPGKETADRVKQGWKAASNKQAKASSNAYLLGANARKLRTPVAITTLVGGGAYAQKQHDDKIWKGRTKMATKVAQGTQKLADRVTGTTREFSVQPHPSGGARMTNLRTRPGNKFFNAQRKGSVVDTDHAGRAVNTEVYNTGGGLTDAGNLAVAGGITGGGLAYGGISAYKDSREKTKQRLAARQRRQAQKVAKMDDTELSLISKDGKGFDLSQKYGFTDKQAQKRTRKDQSLHASPFRGPNKHKNRKNIGLGTGAGAGIGAGLTYGITRSPKVAALVGAEAGVYGGAIGSAVNQQREQGPALQRAKDRGDIRAAKKGEKVSAWTGRIKKSDTVSAFGIEH